MMRRMVPNKCHTVEFEVCQPFPKKKPPPQPPPSPPPKPPGCKVVQNQINMCANVASFPKAIKVPVVLAELDLQICIDVDITLEQPALEIKRVKKDVSLEQCHLVPTSRKDQFKLFISGFVRKNIEYASARPINANAQAVCGSILHTTAHVPFTCCTEVMIKGAHSPEFLTSNDMEARFLDKSGMRPKIDEKLLGHSVRYNELPFCELVDAEIDEFDFAKVNTSTPLPQLAHEHIFTTVQEQIVLDLRVKVLQLQQIPIPRKHDHVEKCCEHRWDCDHEDDEEECCDHDHEKKCKKKRKKKFEHEVEYEEKWDCDHEDDEEECCDHGHEKKCKKKCKKKCDHDEECDHRWDCDHEDDEEDEEECCDHDHEKKCKKKHKKKFEHEVEYEEKWDCDHEDEEECCDHGHKKKCKKKRKKKCEHDHDDEEECCIHDHKKKKKCRIKSNNDLEERRERKKVNRVQKKCKKKPIEKSIKRYREKRKKDF